MSKSALSFLMLTLACVAIVTAGLTGSQFWDLTAKAGIGVFGLLFVASLFVGRRIKFDPVLR